RYDTMIAWAEDALKLIINLHNANLPYHDEFATIRSNYMSLTQPNGALELYHGGLRFKEPDGNTLHDHFDYRQYRELIKEEVKSWSYMKFPYLQELDPETGWYRVGPLARMNNCDSISTAKAEAARVQFKAHSPEPMVHSTLAFHWARMIETLHCAESIKELLHDPDLLSGDLVVNGERRHEGIGVIEAPRGTLFHHYEVDDNDIVTKANLIVSTTSNNQAMNESVRQVANHYLNGQELTEPMLNQIEVAIRAYDPCLSCATHALGKMPMQVELIDSNGVKIDQLNKRSDGVFRP
ncbi:MAG: nickel-dependent hydrogenase large subunit, partial [Chromatiales bacterium]|nr:nickel-dependent hydrogenase large subunit [Chromatiales bacterium]